MKPIGKAISAILIIIFLTSSWSAPAIAASPLHSETGSASYLLFEDENTVTFQVDFPYEKMILETINSNGTNFTKISVPGWTNSNQAGHPALPVHLTQIGAPADSGFELKIIPGKTQKQKVKFPILPAETLLVDPNLPEGDADTGLPEYSINFMPDPSIYSSNQPFPSELVQVTSDGMVRQQRVIGISTFPVQFDPKTNTVIVYESIQVQVTFPETVTKMSPASSSESEIYEGLFSESLINYSTAKSWRKLDKDSIVIDSIKAFSDEISLMGEGDPWSPPNPGWRIKVKDEGFYKLTYAELQAAGLPVDTLDPRTFKVSNLGNEVAIHVEGQTDGKFDPADYILFFGEKLESKYAANNVYWITYEGTTGLRMVIQDGTPLVNDIPVNYPEHLHFEQNITYYSSTPGDNNLERFMWNYIRVPTVRPTFSHSFNLTVPESSQPYTATLRIALLGLTQVSTINPDHKVYVYLNGTQVAAPTWDGQTWNTIDIPIENAQSVLLPGNNTVLIAGTTETGVAADVIYVDWIELDFLNTYQASQNTVAFSYDLAGTWKYQVAGFTSSQVHVYDITNASAPRQITGINAISSGSAYTIQFQDTNGLDETTRYWALETSTYKTAAAIETDSPSDLISTANSADHIVITHKAFSDAAETLSNFRAAKMRAVTVDIQDVYDEFGYGIEGVMPIHNFLAYAYSHWTAPAPSYVVLMGDGNYDPKKNVAASQSTFIPPFLAFVDPSIGETAADNLFVTFSGNDNFPDMMLGRLAVNTAAEANAFVNKIIAYEGKVWESWQNQVLLLADNTDTAGNFALYSDNLDNCCIPSMITTDKVYLYTTHSTAADTRTAFFNAFNTGKLIINYIGHGTTTTWASEALFRIADVPALANGSRQPVILSMDCSDGYYIMPTSSAPALAELVTRAENKGAVASWSPTGYGTTNAHDFLNRGFMNAVFLDPDGFITLGQATTAGKLNLWNTGTNLDLLDTFLLFGDPATPLEIEYPTAVDLLSFTATGSKRSIILEWETASEIDNLGFNLYRSNKIDGMRIKLNEDLIPTNTTPGSMYGAVYSYTDAGLKPRATYNYWLEAVAFSGGTELFGPVNARSLVK